MVCLFCNSRGHQSNQCNLYETEEARKRTPNSNRFCFTCETESAVSHLPQDEKCKTNDSCIALNCFLPKLDQFLLPRFLDMCDMDEKYLIAVSFPTAFNVIPLKHIKIWDSLENYNKFGDMIAVVGSITLYQSNLEKDMKLYDSINAKTIFCFARILDISYSHLPAEIVLQLLSPYTKSLTMRNTVCEPNLSFSDIIKKSPNLEYIFIYDWTTNIIYEKTWAKDLLKYKIGKNLDYLGIKLDAFADMDIENLVKVIQTKCSKTAHINIWFNQHLTIAEEFNKIEEKLFKYFDYKKNEKSWLRISIDGIDYDKFFSLAKLKQP
uniref:Uncharacterized protein n=1 Tax=Panagrolaimus sp. ES5 TaxID=591445 RepID=A0AC34FWU6_9BILA